MDNDNLYESVGNYTKFKLVEMLIDKYKDKISEIKDKEFNLWD